MLSFVLTFVFMEVVFALIYIRGNGNYETTSALD